MNRNLNKYGSYLALTALSLAGFAACRCSCSCSKNLGCFIMTARQTSNDSIVETKIFCSTDLDIFLDTVLRNNMNAFTMKYSGSGFVITSRDSVYQSDGPHDLKCKERDGYEQRGYSCDCYK